MHPAGEDVNDLRVAALRHDIYELLDHLRYTIGAAHGCKNVPRPRRKRLADYNIFKRFGSGKSKTTGAGNVDLAQLDQVGIAQRMKAAAMSMIKREKK
jgi:hypothetical protein